MIYSRKKGVRLQNFIAGKVIKAGGIGIIICVCGILVLITQIAIPLFFEPQNTKISKISIETPWSKADILAVGGDQYLETFFYITIDSVIHFVDIKNGNLIEERSLNKNEKKRLLSVSSYGGDRYELLYSDQSVELYSISFSPIFNDGEERDLFIKIKLIDTFLSYNNGLDILKQRVRKNDEDRLTRIVLSSSGALEVITLSTTENLSGEMETTEISERISEDSVVDFAIGQLGEALYVVLSGGEIQYWDLSNPEEITLLASNVIGESEITTISMVYGDNSVLLGFKDGSLKVVMPVNDPQAELGRKIRVIRSLENAGGSVQRMIPSLRNKAMLSFTENNYLMLDHITSEKRLLKISEDEPLLRFALNISGNGLIAIDEEKTVHIWKLDIPHPEFSLKVLFGKIWYENYQEPDFIWQSSSGSNDFEPKFSLMPLIFGSLKGTFYAMIFAVPLALFGAVYLSQFAKPSLKKFIKPGVEVMASIPTVVIGFLAALWLAPLLDSFLIATFISLIVIPLVFILFYGWTRSSFASKFLKTGGGMEFLYCLPVLCGAFLLCYFIGPFLEQTLFDGDIKQWMYRSLGISYDQRNAIVIAFALGYAVIPIVFTIADDSLSSVPQNMVAASLALGASKWQTVWRVVIPTASPGIFAALIIGFGRAIGETMIVLMATGNTPLMDMSVFNGMRTLAANIAVETPEAPVDGTLYRILFLSAVLLFLFTFTLNTLAELVRQGLRKKYANI